DAIQPDHLVYNPTIVIQRAGLLRDFLLARDGAAWTLLRTCIGVRALTANRETTAMTNPAIAANVHQTLDVHRDLGTQRALDAIVLLDRLTQPVGVGIVQVAHPLVRTDARCLQDLARCRAPDAEDVGQSDLEFLLTRKIDASN